VSEEKMLYAISDGCIFLWMLGCRGNWTVYEDIISSWSESWKEGVEAGEIFGFDR
jgi:hypothetical protein